MRIAIMGAGGIGGLYGGLLARAGEEVTLVARGAHLAALRERGLTVRRDAETFTVRPAQATDDPAAVGPVELVVVATKAYDLERAVRAMRPLVGPETMVLPLLNGVDIPERIGRAIDPARVLGGLTYMPANRPEPGVVHQPGPARRLLFGEWGGGRSARTGRLLAVLERAGANAELSADMRRDTWSKWMLVTANGGVCGVTGSTIGPVLRDPDTRALYAACCREVEALARAQGIAIAADAVEETLHHADTTPPHNKPSMLQDLEQGKPLELDFLNGTAARLGRELGVPVPVNAFIHAALKLRAAGSPRG